MFPFTLQQLRILKAIAIEKNFTKAADLLYLSQPSLSKQIQRLEKNMKVSLIHRKANKISLTENGKILFKYSDRILGLCEECCRVFHDLNTAECSNLRIGATSRIGQYFLPKLFELFLKKYPFLHWNLTINSAPKILRSIQNRDLDFGFVPGPISDSFRQTIGVEPLVNDEIRLVIPKSHVFAANHTLSKEALYHLNFISFNSGSKFRKFLEKNLSENQIDVQKLKIILQVNSMETMKIAVKLGLGAAFVASSTLEKERQFLTIQFLQIENTNLRQSFLLLTNLQSSKAEAFQFLKMEFSRLQNNG